MDTFIEQIVPKKKDGKEIAVILLIVLAFLILTVALFFLSNIVGLGAIFPLLVLGLGYGGWHLISGQNKEFEYCVTNGDIDIDCIIARRKRKRLVSVAGRKVETLLPFDANKPLTGYQRIVVTASSLQASGLWCFTYHSKKNGHTLVVFQPELRVLRALYSGTQKLVQLDAARAARELGVQLDGRFSSNG